METVRVRFAPSPTGHLHIGGARTSLFNWLYARRMGGTFILRIEDTDRERSRDEYTEAILDSLTWLGMDWDEGPFYQSQRDDCYQEAIGRLLSEKKAYRCYCTPEELEEKRDAAMKRGEKPKYDGTCRGKDLPHREEPYVVRFHSPESGVTEFTDLIKGKIIFENRELDDLIIRRSDGSPTYNFTVVVDDTDMNITHVIRGDDHINNTPRQILIFQALGYTVPAFAHVPMIFGSDHKKLSKRHGALSTTEYRQMGYLPEALVNYLVRLGWSHGDQEIFSIEELKEAFTVEDVGKSAGVFNPEKLEWLNGHYIRQADPTRIARDIVPILSDRGYEGLDAAWLARAVETLQERAKTLVEMADMGDFYFTDGVTYDEKGADKFLKASVTAPLQEIKGELSALSDWSAANIESAFNRVLERFDLKLGKIAQPLRVALTGTTVSPGIYEIIDVLGRKRVTERIDRALEYISSKGEA
ncbi:MAG: glutamate--tRNA ligase [Deltaproteobacteria bacterium]|nr:glutamate--tRNA ligase [Candidatus Zymogenaceae bacterium]